MRRLQNYLGCFPTLLLLLLASCSSPENPPKPMQQIPGRNHAAVYRAGVPEGWIKKGPAKKEPLADTRKPIYELTVPDEAGEVLITVHNFPTERFEERVPPEAQIARWRGQLPEGAFAEVKRQAFGGFYGLRIEAEEMIAWAMLLAPEHYPKVSGQRRADITIKAVGPPAALARHREALIAFARSFELIEEIPEE